MLDQERHETSAGKAARLFTEVSREYPASVVFQGTRLAELCEAQNLKPSQLSSSLLADQGLVTRLVTTANALHASNHVETSAEEPFLVSEDVMREIIVGDFTIANDMLGVSSEERNKFLGLFPAFETTVGLVGRSAAETAYRGIAFGLVEKNQPKVKYSQSPSGLTVVKFG